MSKGSILIVEDEPIIADDIAATLEKYGYQISDIVDEASDAIEHLSSANPDLALLDVNIEGNMDGIQLAQKIDIPFVYLTSYYDSITLDRAKKTLPSGYIVKPFRDEDLIANVEMALCRTNESILPGAPEKLFVRKGQEILSIMSSEILYAEALDNYANVYTEKEKYIVSHTLKSIEDKLLVHGFRRVHRSYLINFHHIDSISENYIFLKGHKVPIGKSFRKKFIESLSML